LDHWFHDGAADADPVYRFMRFGRRDRSLSGGRDCKSSKTQSLLAMLLVVSAGSAVVLSFAWRLYFDRPEELDKRIPTSSNERRRRKKEFFDWLDTQGRR
jgi:hypothetical protein